jgi:sphingomyelin phosphodiesterase acid-like 3
MRDFPAGGYFSVPLKPLRRVRVVVLNDIFLSTRYETCKSAADEAPANAEMDWLEKQLSDARATGEKVWVMGHIPPGVNAYATLSKLTDVCAGEKAEMFLNADRMDALMARDADEIRLGLFAHTHMDEMRLVGVSGAAATHAVAVKLVPSISPVDGNNPSFTVARVDQTGELKDYAVVVAKDKAGSAWAEEYDYAATYHEKDFSPAAGAGLIAEFKADPKAQQPASQEYIKHYFKGDMGLELTPLWWQYACSLDGLTGESFSKCVCAAAK